MSRTVPEVTRYAVMSRCQFRCERCGLRQMQGLHVSHRQPRGMGGSRSRTRPHHRLSNLNALCAKCHLRVVERSPVLAEAEGFRCQSWQDTLLVPVRMHYGWVFLDDRGGVTFPPMRWG